MAAAVDRSLNFNKGYLKSLLKEAEYRLKQGDPADAERLLRQAWDFSPGRRDIAVPLAKLLMSGGRGGEAEHLLRIAIARAPDVDVLNRLGEHRLKQGDLIDAEHLLRQAWELDRGRRAVAMSLGKLLVDSGRGREAEEVLRLAIARAPDAGLLNRLGDYRLKQGDLIDAEHLLRQAWELDRGRRAVAMPLGKLLIDSGRGREAEEVLRLAIARAPDAGLLNRLGEHRLKQGELIDAEHLLRQAWELDRGRRAVAMPLGKLLMDSGRGKEAEEVLRLAIARAPDAGLLNRLAEHRLKQGDLIEAEALFRKARSVDPRHSGVIAGLSKLLQDDDRREEGLAVIESALAIAPDDPTLLMELGKFHSREDRPGEARRAFIRATKIADAPAKCWVQLASFAARYESSKASIDYLRRAIAVVGRHAELETSLVERLINYGMIAEAEKAQAQALDLFPENTRLLRHAVNLDILSGRRSSAFNKLRSIARRDARLREEVFLLAARTLKSQWKIEQARKVLARLVRGPNARIGDHNALAEVHLLATNITAAKRSLRAAAALKQIRERRNISQGLVGELINDFSTDDAALRATNAAYRSNSTQTYIETVRHLEGHTGCAISFFVHLRRTGALETKQLQDRKRIIPASIYQYWDSEETPEDIANLMKSWIEFNSGWDHRIFSNKQAQAYLGSRNDAGAYHAFRLAPSNAGRADILRLALLFDHGGVYADADDRCLMPLNAILAGRELVARQETFGSIGNNFLAVRAGHPVMRRALNEAVSACLRGDRESIWLSSGPGLLTRALASYLADDPARLDELGRTMMIADLHEVRRFCISNCQAAYKHSKRNWQKAEFSA